MGETEDKQISVRAMLDQQGMFLKDLATPMHEYYQALRDEGFTSAEAFKLTIDYHYLFWLGANGFRKS